MMDQLSGRRAAGKVLAAAGAEMPSRAVLLEHDKAQAPCSYEVSGFRLSCPIFPFCRIRDPLCQRGLDWPVTVRGKKMPQGPSPAISKHAHARHALWQVCCCRLERVHGSVSFSLSCDRDIRWSVPLTPLQPALQLLRRQHYRRCKRIGSALADHSTNQHKLVLPFEASATAVVAWDE